MRKVLTCAVLAAGAAWSGPLSAGGAYCEPDWSPEAPDLECASQIAIAPGNDSRVNLFLMALDQRGENGAGIPKPDLGWRDFYGQNYFRWQDLMNAWSPRGADLPPYDPLAFEGTRCQTLRSGSGAFSAALSASRTRQRDQNLLLSARSMIQPICEDGLTSRPQGWLSVFTETDDRSQVIAGDPASGYLAYVDGAAAFYAREWQAARTIFLTLQRDGADPWIEETAAYMVARTSLNEAIDGASDRWGWFDLDIADSTIAARAQNEFESYLAAYPEGTYAASASGLIRKTLWLQQEYDALGQIYAARLANAETLGLELGPLIEEVDDKFLIRYDFDAAQGPMLVAAHNLMRMRETDGRDGENARYLSEEALEAQAPIFAGHDALFGLLKANHAFYVRRDFREVLRLLPDDARQESYDPVAFSRQYLRGLALHALDDRNEAGFWLELIEGASGLHQKEAIELALAREWEREGQVARAFGPDSPIRDTRIRGLLLTRTAGPAILKQQVRDTSASEAERRLALFTVLHKQLLRRDYRGFLDDYRFAQQLPDGEGSVWNPLGEGAPLELFTAGVWEDGYSCPDLGQTVTTLASRPRDVKARLCLGDFLRLNGLSEPIFGHSWREDALGHTDRYPGLVHWRHDIYTDIIARRGVSRDDRAYALFRAIRCYAPTNSNTCGGEGVEESQRASWFRRLKRDFGDTQWGQELEYYW